MFFPRRKFDGANMRYRSKKKKNIRRRVIGPYKSESGFFPLSKYLYFTSFTIFDFFDVFFDDIISALNDGEDKLVLFLRVSPFFFF